MAKQNAHKRKWRADPWPIHSRDEMAELQVRRFNENLAFP